MIADVVDDAIAGIGLLHAADRMSGEAEIALSTRHRCSTVAIWAPIVCSLQIVSGATPGAMVK
jgi:hypothetical protein